MHNDTPIGATMHLKELDRQASPKLHPLQAMRQHGSPVTRLFKVNPIISSPKRLNL
jgi:hypothetical protein